MAHPVRVFIDNAGPELNSSASDYAPVISADEATIFITSRRAGSMGGKEDPEGNGYFEDIYQASWKGKAWSRATRFCWCRMKVVGTMAAGSGKHSTL